MKKLSDIFEKRGLALERELVKVEKCQNCDKELKTFRMQIIGGSRNGEWATVTEECDCILAQQVLEAVNRTKLKFFRELSILNQSIKQATLENYIPNHESQIIAIKKAIEFIEKVSKNKQARMIYYGESGLGKSHLAVGIEKLLEDKFYKTALFLEVPTLKQMVKASWTKDSNYSELELMKAVSEADLLILDDVGAEGITPWTKELLFTILNLRLSKSLLVTTNLSLSEIYMEYGPKITDRILENMSKQDMLKVEGNQSYRLKNF
ncbi:ATP-binding protein [Cytobacillus sp. Hz8]|uniref:ATP-binding protein n=1 Tax=Cytobacillus sp. Hz8 TaxID=3347168 RepID=UPI0035DAFEB3